MSILETILDYLVEHTWTGRQFGKFVDYREKHPIISLLCLPLDYAFLSIIFVGAALLVVMLAGLIAYPVRWLGGDDIEVLLFGLGIIGVGFFFIRRSIIQRRQKR